MKVTDSGNTIILEANSGSLSEFASAITINSYKDKNVIVVLNSFGRLTAKDFAVFADWVKLQKKNKKSLVLVADTDFNKTGKFIVVPTVQEAHDLIEMDEIERDLGF